MPLKAILTKSKNKDKKFTVVIYENDKKLKTVHFGANGMSDFTKHKDPQRKRLYILRHMPNQNWKKSGLKTAGFWSRWLLWNKKTISDSIKDIENRFNINIIYNE